MTVNEFIRKVKWDTMLSNLDIPIRVNGKEIDDVELIKEQDLGNGMGVFSFNLKIKK